MMSSKFILPNKWADEETLMMRLGLSLLEQSTVWWKLVYSPTA